MRPRSLLILALVVGALLALIYYAEDRVAGTDERAAAARRLVGAAPEEIVALELEWQGSRVRFERAAKSAESSAAARGERPWRIVEPFVHLADDAGVGRLLAALTALEAVRDLDGVVRGDVGLEPPRGSVSWTTATGSGTLEVGGGVPATRDVVVAASGRVPLAVASGAFVDDLARPAGEWRSRTVVAAARDRIERVAISPVAGESVVLARSGETLSLESPVADLADRDLADRLLADLQALRIETFLDPPLAADAEAALAGVTGGPGGAGAQGRLGTIELTIAGESAPLRIEIGAERTPGRRVWRAGGQAFESASALGDLLARPVREWRSRNWTRFENWRIEKARFEDPAGAFELARRDGEWLRDGKRIPFAAASDLLAALTAARAERLAELPAAPAGTVPAQPPVAPKLTVTLSDADGNEELLTLYESRDPAAAVVPARARGREVEILLPRDLATELEKKVAAVRAAALSPADS